MLGIGQLKIIKSLIQKKKTYSKGTKESRKNPKIKIFKMNKDETPWSMDIYFNGVKKIKKILEKIKLKLELFTLL